MAAGYDREFFEHLRGGVRSARRMLPIVFDIVRPRTLIDVGCGIGAWASVGKELGCAVSGIDGDWVPKDQLLIGADEFRVVDLASTGTLSGRYDLAMSLEVGEHLPAASASNFVRLLTSLAPVVMFSAAMPWQRGTHHVNEQYPSYWARLFEAQGYDTLDLVRPVCWNDAEIEFFYRQNVLLFASPEQSSTLRARQPACRAPLDVIHPDAVPILAQGWVESLGSMKALKLLSRVLKSSVRRRLT